MKRAKSGVFAGELTQLLRSGKILLSPGTFLDILGNLSGEERSVGCSFQKAGRIRFP